MDRHISTEEMKSKKWKKWIIYGIVAAAVLYGIYMLRNTLKPQLTQDDILYATVQSGEMENTISALGIIKPSTELLITSPLTSRIKKTYLKEGETVKTGSIIMSLDTEFAQLEYSKLQDQLKMKQNNVDRLQLNLEKNIRDIEIDNGIKDLQLKALRAKLKDVQRLKNIGGGTTEDIEQVQQSIAIAQLEKKKLENELSYRKASLKSDVKNEELESSIQQKVLNELGKKIALTSVKAPSQGVITWMNKEIGTTVSEGQELVKIAQLDNFIIEGTASDIHTEKINVGLPVRVKINKERLDGYVEQILPSVENNTVKFRVLLNTPESQLLRANMKVELSLVESSKKNSIYVQNTRTYKGGRTQDFFFKEGDRLVKRRCTIGITNSENIEIISGAKKGDQLVISDMIRYEDQDIVPLNKK